MMNMNNPYDEIRRLKGQPERNGIKVVSVIWYLSYYVLWTAALVKYLLS